MEIFTALLALCVSFDVFFDWRLNQAVEQTIDTAAIWEAIVPIMTSLYWIHTVMVRCVYDDTPTHPQRHEVPDPPPSIDFIYRPLFVEDSIR